MERFTRGWMNQIQHIGMEQNMFHLDVFGLPAVEVITVDMTAYGFEMNTDLVRSSREKFTDDKLAVPIV